MPPYVGTPIPVGSLVAGPVQRLLPPASFVVLLFLIFSLKL